MRRPTRQRVIDAVNRDMEHGHKRLIEAVELDSGTMVVEYEVRAEIQDIGTHVQFRVIVESADQKTYQGMIRDSYFVDRVIR